MKSVTKLDIVESIAKKTGLEVTVVRRLVQRTLDGIIDIIEQEGRFEVRNFGVFQVQVRKPRTARNPRTGERAAVPAKRVVRFKPGMVMRRRVEAGVGDTALPAVGEAGEEASTE
jgi:nucleoid DNA-binding protein